MQYYKVLPKFGYVHWGITHVQHKVRWYAKIMKCTQWVMNPVLSSSHWYLFLGTRILSGLSFLVMPCKEAANAFVQALRDRWKSQRWYRCPESSYLTPGWIHTDYSKMWIAICPSAWWLHLRVILFQRVNHWSK